MVRDRFVVEVPDAGTLKACVQRVRQVEKVFDAYRVTPGN
jgi:GTP pyrophosphokinase